jgi:4-amino-4-deoxy-L-arabinose transferase-like glycosyltransferase
MNRWILGLAITAACASAWLSWKTLGAIPHISDEVSYSFQGRMIASGCLYGFPPPVPEAFAVDHILMTQERWCSIYSPGWPLMLAVGWMIRMPWVVNPILLLLSIFGIWRLGRIVYDDRTALLAAVLFCVSPFVLLMSAGFMSHVASLCAAIWCLVFLAGGKRNRDFWIAGFLAGFGFLVRPYTTVTLLWPAVLWYAWSRKSEWRSHSVRVVIGFLPAVIFLLIYNSILFGGPFKTGYDSDPMWNQIHFRLSHFGQNVAWYLNAMRDAFWGWPFPDLMLLLFLIKPRSGWQTDLVLFLCSLSLLIGYCFLSYRDIVYSGPRFVFEMTGFVALLSARAIFSLYDRVRKFRVASIAARIAIVILCLYPLATRLPAQIQYHSQVYHGQSQEFIRLVNGAKVGQNALVLIAGDPFVFRSFFFNNALIPPDGSRVFVHDLPGREVELQNAFQREETWRVTIELKPLPGPNT